MIITRTPYRISFFGGGTDYPDWYLKNGGQVLATTIDKYCYLTCRYLPPFFEHRIRLVYSTVEMCQNYEEIQHPAVRETLRFLKFDRGLEIHHDGDLPARSGMGSSSSFTVGLLHALYALKGEMVSKKRLTEEAIHIEQNMIKETVGSQDQTAAAYGGLNHIQFRRSGEIDLHPIIIPKGRKEELSSHLMLFYTGIMRTASDIAKSYVEDIEGKRNLLERMEEMVHRGISILQSNGCIVQLGELLHEAWAAKRGLSPNVSNGTVNDLYERARKAGAIGGKILGAGGGGFLLLFVAPSDQGIVREALSELLHVPFSFESRGSEIILYDPDEVDYSAVDRDRVKRCLKPFQELNTVSTDDERFE